MSVKNLVMDGFVRDENGKLQIVPMKVHDFRELDAGSNKKSDQQPRRVRKYIPIEPLGSLPYVGFSPDRKKRKIEMPVRKELFKVPAAKPEKVKPLSARRSLTRQSIVANRRDFNFSRKRTPRPSFLPSTDNAETPLIAVDEAEKLLDRSGIINTPMITIAEASDNESTPEKEKSAKQNSDSNESLKSEMEFLQLEKKMANKENYPESPMSSVCFLLKNTKLNRSDQKLDSKRSKAYRDIKILLKQNHNEIQLMKEQVERFELQHQRLVDTIDDIFNSPEDLNKKEDRHTDRSALRNSFKKNKFNVSPVVTKSVDLRKTTLNRNLTKTLENDVGSPRTRRAVNMYNNIRNDCSILCTPKTDRSTIDIAQKSVTRSLSRRVQQQCLMLQDTPKH